MGWFNHQLGIISKRFRLKHPQPSDLSFHRSLDKLNRMQSWPQRSRVQQCLWSWLEGLQQNPCRFRNRKCRCKIGKGIFLEGGSKWLIWPNIFKNLQVVLKKAVQNDWSQLMFFCKLTWCGIFFPPHEYTSVLHWEILGKAAKFRYPRLLVNERKLKTITSGGNDHHFKRKRFLEAPFL